MQFHQIVPSPSTALMTGKLSTGDKYCICEICINSCHAGHDTTFIDQFNFHGFCDCGDEGLRGIRSCKMLKGTVLMKFILCLDLVKSMDGWKPIHHFSTLVCTDAVSTFVEKMMSCVMLLNERLCRCFNEKRTKNFYGAKLIF